VALLCRGGQIGGYVDEDTARAVERVFGADCKDITWVTPVLEEHFTYHSSILAGTSRPGLQHNTGISAVGQHRGRKETP